RGPPEWLPLRRHEMHKRHEPGGERSAQLHFRDAAALKSRTHVACPGSVLMDGRGTSCACGFPVPRAVVTCMEPQHKVPLGHVLPTQAFLKKESSHLVYPQA
ncbi:unnamed protein product, partial [Pylaiella littoralis]